MRKVIVEILTGLVINVIEINPDDTGSFDNWTVPDGQMILNDGLNAQPGVTWNGISFDGLALPSPTRRDEIQSKIIDGTVSLDEWQELWRIDLGIQGQYEFHQKELTRSL